MSCVGNVGAHFLLCAVGTDENYLSTKERIRQQSPSAHERGERVAVVERELINQTV